jgi:Ras-related protein Rab-7A
MSVALNNNCKVLVLGDRGVGKTAIVHRFTSAEFRADFKATIGVDFFAGRISVGNSLLDLQIWDTAGEERHNALAPVVFRGVDACILVFDVSDVGSFAHLASWRRQVIDHTGIDQPEEFPFIVFANKCDLAAEATKVAMDQAKTAVEEQHMSLFPVSAKTGQNILEGFETLGSKFMQWRKLAGRSSRTMLRIQPEAKSSNVCCK